MYLTEEIQQTNIGYDSINPSKIETALQEATEYVHSVKTFPRERKISEAAMEGNYRRILNRLLTVAEKHAAQDNQDISDRCDNIRESLEIFYIAQK